MNGIKKVRVKKLCENAVLPRYGSPSAAGADLYALTDGESVSFAPGQTKMIRTGIAMEIPEGYVGLIYARSGIACKRSLAPANKVGVIDSDSRGEIMVSLYNHSNKLQTVASGERVAQLVVMPYVKADFCECETLGETDRAAGGFGSTGTK